MPISDVVLVLVGNLEVTLPQLVLIITTLGSLIFMAVDMRFGLMILFFLYGVEVIIFWSAGVAAIDLTLSVMCLLAALVMMTLSLLVTRSKQPPGVGRII